MSAAKTPNVDDTIERIALLLATHSQGAQPTEKEIAEYVGNGLILLRHALNSLVRIADAADRLESCIVGRDEYPNHKFAIHKD